MSSPTTQSSYSWSRIGIYGSRVSKNVSEQSKPIAIKNTIIIIQYQSFTTFNIDETTTIISILGGGVDYDEVSEDGVDYDDLSLCLLSIRRSYKAWR